MKPMVCHCSTKALTILIISGIFWIAVPSMTQASESIKVAEAAICAAVVDLQCQGRGSEFSSELGKLYCFTRIVGAKRPSNIMHVWYHGDKERARIFLDVNSPNWRTYSSKVIQPHELGQWHVDVLGPNHEPLHTIHFNIVP